MSHDNRGDGLAAVGQFKRRLSLWRSKPRLRKADPARSQSGGACRQHQVFCRKSAILNNPRALRLCRDHDQHRRMIEDVELRIAHQLLEMRRGQCGRRRTKHISFRLARDARRQIPVANDGKYPGLLVDRTGRLNGSFDKLPKDVLTNWFSREIAHGAAVVDGVFEVRASGRGFRSHGSAICCDQVPIFESRVAT